MTLWLAHHWMIVLSFPAYELAGLLFVAYLGRGKDEKFIPNALALVGLVLLWPAFALGKLLSLGRGWMEAL
jgi:hypothetical protein